MMDMRAGKSVVHGFHFIRPGIAQGDFSMAYVITDTCTKDNLCVDACPSEAIRPLKSEPAWETTPQLYINPADCMDCGGCVAECPTNSIFAIEDLPADKLAAAEKNAKHFE
jgi:NAD-dependent dihydropyrimidine dehydrogenase PreA subunit